MNEESIFAEAAAKKTPVERAAYLDGACGRDKELRNRIEQLLAAHSNPDAFLEEPPPGLERTVAFLSVTKGPGTQLVACGTEDGKIVTRNVADELQTTSWQTHQTRVNGLEFSKDGQYIVSCSNDGFVKLWKTKNLGLVSEQTREAGQWWATVAPNGRSILTTGEDGYAVVRDLNTLETRFRFPHLGGSGLCLAHSPSGRWLAASTLDGQIHIWDVHSNRK